MAEAPELFSEQELTCSICLDLFSQPVSTPCGHNFCQACIGGYWASSAVCTCPLCKRQFDERPRLSVNKVFALIADKYKVTRYGAAGPPASPWDGAGAALSLTKVKSPPKLRQIGVFLDVDEGQVSFYNVKSGSEIYSFSGTSEFSERMFPLLGTGDKEVPLVLVSPQHLA